MKDIVPVPSKLEQVANLNGNNMERLSMVLVKLTDLRNRTLGGEPEKCPEKLATRAVRSGSAGTLLMQAEETNELLDRVHEMVNQVAAL